LIVGLGKKAKATVHGVRSAPNCSRFSKPRGIPNCLCAAGDGVGCDGRGCAGGGRGGFLGDYDPDTYRSDRKDLSVKSFTVAAPERSDGVQADLARA